MDLISTVSCWLVAQFDKLPLWIGAGAAVYAARNGVLAIRINRDSTRIASTMELVRGLINDEVFVHGHKMALHYSKKQEEFKAMGTATNYPNYIGDQKEDIDKLKLFMSVWEAIAIGIEKDAYDEGIIRSSLKGPCVITFDLMLPFIEGVRMTNKRSAVEWEKLVVNWREQPQLR